MVLLLCDGFAPDITLTGNVNTNVRARTMPIFPEVCTVALTLSRPYQKQGTTQVNLHLPRVQIMGRENLLSCRSPRTGISPAICHRLFDHFRQLVCDMDRRPDASRLAGRRQVLELGILPVSLFGRA